MLTPTQRNFKKQMAEAYRNGAYAETDKYGIHERTVSYSEPAAKWSVLIIICLLLFFSPLIIRTIVGYAASSQYGQNPYRVTEYLDVVIPIHNTLGYYFIPSINELGVKINNNEISKITCYEELINYREELIINIRKIYEVIPPSEVETLHDNLKLEFSAFQDVLTAIIAAYEDELPSLSDAKSIFNQHNTYNNYANDFREELISIFDSLYIKYSIKDDGTIKFTLPEV